MILIAELRKAPFPFLPPPARFIVRRRSERVGEAGRVAE
jgi:hypothetical protein